VSTEQQQFAILAGVVSALILAAWFIGGRQPVKLGAVAVSGAIDALGLFLEK
jgi:hypothetical protein